MHTASHANRAGDSSSRPERCFKVAYTVGHHLRHSGGRPTGAPSSTTGHTACFPPIRKEACFFSRPRCVTETAGFFTFGTDRSTKAAFSQCQERTNVFAIHAKASRTFSTDRSSGSFPCLTDQLNHHIRIALSTPSNHLFHLTFAPVLLESLVHKLWQAVACFGHSVAAPRDHPVHYLVWHLS
jgi:hypothetical protein